MKNHYKTLGVSRHASLKEIKSAYKKLAFRFHPDHNQGNMAAEEYFKEVNGAYHVLGDKERKLEYDALLQLRNSGTPEPTSTTYYTPYTRPRRPFHTRQEYYFDKSYYKSQALAIIIVLLIAALVISITKINSYYKERAKEELRLENQKVLSAAQSKFNTGDFYGALQMVQGLAAKNPADFELNIERDKMIEDLYQKALRHFNMHDYKNAIFHFLTVKEFQHPQKLETYDYLAQCFAAIQEYEKAVAAYEYIYLRDEYNLDLILRIAMLYHYKIHDQKNAFKYYDIAKTIFKDRQRQLYGEAFELLMNPGSTPDIYYNIFYNRAKFHMETGDFETAITDCNWAIFLRKEKCEPHILRAQGYYQLGDSENACEDYNLALEKGLTPDPTLHFCR